MVPKQHASGGKQKLVGVSKRGNTYLRTLLVHGARSVIYRVQNMPESFRWIDGVVSRRNKNVAAEALASQVTSCDKNSKQKWLYRRLLRQP
jgi:transposase